MLNTSDPFAAPLIDPGFYISGIDFKIMKFGIRSVQRFLTVPAWKDYIVEPLNGMNNTTIDTDADLEEYIRSNTMTVFHPTGTSSMSPVGAKWGIVDPDLRVKGVSGLRIVDLSVLVSAFPSDPLISEIDPRFSFFLTFKPIVPAAHPHVPTYIVSERAGDLIKKAWNSSIPL